MFQFRRPLTRNTLRTVQKLSTKVSKNANVEFFPEKLLHKKQKTPAYMYLANAKAAQLIDQAMLPFLQSSKYHTALEMNPGIGLFSQKLLEPNKSFSNIVLMETLEHFLPFLEDLKERNANRVKIKIGDLVHLWKMAYQDKMDSGMRVTSLLEGIPTHANDQDGKIMIFGAVGSYSFFKHLINSIVFQNSIFTNGRSEMFLVMPPPIYIHLTCSNDIGYMIYRSSSILFQILFEYRFIAEVPRDHFLPIQTEYTINKGSKLKKVKSINPENLYLVKISPRRNIFELCPEEYLPALWYFVKQNCISRRNRIIPNLEKFIPGCGPRLIVNADSSDNVAQLFPDEDSTKLPKYSVPCTTMSCENYYPNMNIYTQFGDLNASQMLTLFTQFRKWPEYSESSFLASLESSLLKLESSADESIDGIAEEDDDIVGTELTDELHAVPSLDPPKPTAATKAKRKKKTPVDL